MTEKKQRKKVIGITGGTGCGKTVVMNILKERFNGGLIIADLIGHELMAPGGANYKEIVKVFGEDILDEDGKINRPRLSKIVFSDKEKLEMLNQISHPNIEKAVVARLEEMQKDESISFIALEAALLIECGYMKYLDELWYVYADEETRIRRLIAGRGYSEEKSRSVMKNQLKEEEYLRHSNRLIDNSGSEEDTYETIRLSLEEKPL